MIIYRFYLRNDIEMSPIIRDKIKLMAYLIYSELIDYEKEINKDVLFKNNIVFNELDVKNGQYEFEHIDYETGNYEPFMIDDDGFGFTIYDGSISNEDLNIIIDEVKKMIQLNFEFDIYGVKVSDSDERKTVINSFYSDTKELQRKKN